MRACLVGSITAAATCTLQLVNFDTFGLWLHAMAAFKQYNTLGRIAAKLFIPSMLFRSVTFIHQAAQHARSTAC